ncbi:MAG: hypothetical protein HKO53_18215, partial [Gemmatimonadetes bacterium]|nr:hypothetical protein [Gemmatimonadota bacterium]
EWVSVDGNVLSGLGHVFGSAPDNVYVAGEGGLFRFDGSSWTEIELGISSSFAAVDILPTGEFLMATPAGRVYGFDGANFIIEDVAFGFAVRDAWITAPGEFFVLGSDGRVSRRSEGTWSPQDAPTFAADCVAASPRADGTAVLLDRSGRIFESSAGTTSLNSLVVPARDAARGIWGASRDRFVVSLADGGFLHREDGRWLLRRLEGFAPRGLWSRGGAPLVATGFGSPGLAVFDGTAWSAAPVPTVEFMAIHGTGPDHIVAVGNNGTVAIFDGDAWTEERLNTSFALTAVFTTGPDHILVANRGRRFIAHYDGQTWSDLPPIQPLGGQLATLWGSSATDVTLLMVSGALYRRSADLWDPLREGDALGVREAVPFSTDSTVLGTVFGDFYAVEGDSLVLLPTPPETRTSDVMWVDSPDRLLLGGPDGAVWGWGGLP